MGRRTLTPQVLELIAERFKALAEPNRLLILSTLRAGELTVGELVEETELSQANVSKHLRVLHATGFVARRKDGLNVHYRLADPGVLALCDLMCGRLEREHSRRARLIESA